MKKLTILTTIFLLSVTSHSFAVSKKADMGSVGSCMRPCVQTLNPLANDAYATDISVDEFTLDCDNYCNPNLKDGYCSPEADKGCNVMYQDTDVDCVPPLKEGYEPCVIDIAYLSNSCAEKYGSQGEFSLYCRL